MMYEVKNSGCAPPVLRNQSTVNGGLPLITGYAAVFNTLSHPLTDDKGRTWYKEVIRPGAFLRSLMAAASGETDVLARFDHTGILARTSSGTLRLREDSRGLHYSFELPDTTVGRDLAELIRRGDISGSSFAFNPVQQQWRQEGKQRIRELHDVTLIDISPVVRPAYPGTTGQMWLGGQAGAMQMQLELAKRV